MRNFVVNNILVKHICLNLCFILTSSSTDVYDIGTYVLDIKSTMNIKTQRKTDLTPLSWKNFNSTSFVLTENNTRIKCTYSGIVKVELAMTIGIKADPTATSVLLCINNISQDKMKICQQFRLFLKNGSIMPITLFWSYRVSVGDMIEASIVGLDAVRKVYEFNRLLVYYI